LEESVEQFMPTDYLWLKVNPVWWGGVPAITNISAMFHATNRELISSYEYNHYCKPHLEFYIEVLESLQKQPEQCMMVGNDVKDDLVASKLGIQTYLITDYVLNRCQLPVECTHQGSYKDFYQFACDLPEVGC